MRYAKNYLGYKDEYLKERQLVTSVSILAFEDSQSAVILSNWQSLRERAARSYATVCGIAGLRGESFASHTGVEQHSGSFELARPCRQSETLAQDDRLRAAGPRNDKTATMIKAVRGTRDLLPPETALWNFVEAAVRDVFRAYNFQEIRTPIFESTELFARGVGEETDIVAKEMYTWEDRGRAQSDKGQSLTLRPENTAGVVRAYIEHKLWDRGLNKLYYIGPQFRRERPQKGRYRQFYQIGAEVIGPATAGSESPARDAEVLEMLATLLDRLGIKDWTLRIEFGRLRQRPRALQRSVAQGA